MSVNVTLVVIGVVLCVIGLAMLGSSQRAEVDPENWTGG
jgi:hypothetical protein